MIFPALLIMAMLGENAESPAPGLLQRYSADGIHDWSSLTLYVDNTFKYESRGGSCWVWQDWHGTWSKKNDLLYLNYSITIDESQERIAKMGTIGDASRILVVVSLPNGAPLKDVLVTFNGHGYESPTGADGRAFVDYEEIPEFYGYGACKSRRLEQLTVKDGKHDISFAVDQPLSNYFDVVLDPEPKTREEARQDVYRMKAQKVILIRDGSPERAEAFGESRPRVLRAEDGEAN